MNAIQTHYHRMTAYLSGDGSLRAEGRCRVRSLQKHLAADSFKIDELVLHRLEHHGKCNILYMSYRTSLCLCRMYRTVPTVLGPGRAARGQHTLAASTRARRHTLIESSRILCRASKGRCLCLGRFCHAVYNSRLALEELVGWIFF